jgi:hypothetical protein
MEVVVSHAVISSVYVVLPVRAASSDTSVAPSPHVVVKGTALPLASVSVNVAAFAGSSKVTRSGSL